LEAIRSEVLVRVERDPERVLQPTEAQTVEREDGSILFPVHGYTTDAIMADKRSRIAFALRQTGVPLSDYALQIIR
jgi:hypothetical protein